MLVLLWTTVLDSRGLLLQGGRPRQRGQRSLDCRLILYDFVCCVLLLSVWARACHERVVTWERLFSAELRKKTLVDL